MGYLKTIPIDTLQLPSNPEFHVRMRARGFYGLSRESQSAMIQMDSKSVDPQTGNAVGKAELGEYTTTLLLGNPQKGIPGLLVDWNLTDENDQPLPMNLAGLDKLEPEDGHFLEVEANKRVKLRGKVAEANFATPS